MKEIMAKVKSSKLMMSLFAVVGLLGAFALEHYGFGAVTAAVSSPASVTPEAALTAKGSGAEKEVSFPIAGGYTKPEWKRTLLNSKADYKDPTNLTICVMKTVPGFDDPKSLIGRVVTVKGNVVDYKGSSEIVVTSPTQISLK